jgi:hypothetical protein
MLFPFKLQAGEKKSNTKIEVANSFNIPYIVSLHLNELRISVLYEIV